MTCICTTELNKSCGVHGDILARCKAWAKVEHPFEANERDNQCKWCGGAEERHALIFRNRILIGDVREQLALLPAESVHMVCTSPPYWGLRDYKTDGQLGLEATPEEYVANMVAVFREVRRVLRSDGCVFLNLGDSYFGTGKGPTHPTGFHAGDNGDSYPVVGVYSHATLKPKDLVGIPWRVAFALQADGWWLRSDIIWSKPNPMPESVTDRPTKAHEYVFLLTKSERYYYDADAIREPHAEPWRSGNYEHSRDRPLESLETGRPRSFGWNQRDYNPSGRNRRTVWESDYEVGYNEEQWTGVFGSCQRCGKLKVAGFGSAPTTAPAMGDSLEPTAPHREKSEPIEPSMKSLWDQSETGLSSITSAGIKGASIPPISSPSPLARISAEPAHGAATSHTASTGTPSHLKTLLSALKATGNAVCACENERVSTGDVWRVATEAFPLTHFATFPTELVKPCIQAGTSEHGCCAECGAPWRRVVERSRATHERGDDPSLFTGRAGMNRERPGLSDRYVLAVPQHELASTLKSAAGGHEDEMRAVFGSKWDHWTRTDDSGARVPTFEDAERIEELIGVRVPFDGRRGGWEPTCKHKAPLEPAIVLDPFGGSGTTGLVAKNAGRDYVLIELNPDYVAMAEERIGYQERLL